MFEWVFVLKVKIGQDRKKITEQLKKIPWTPTEKCQVKRKTHRFRPPKKGWTKRQEKHVDFFFVKIVLALCLLSFNVDEDWGFEWYSEHFIVTQTTKECTVPLGLFLQVFQKKTVSALLVSCSSVVILTRRISY